MIRWIKGAHSWMQQASTAQCQRASRRAAQRSGRAVSAWTASASHLDFCMLGWGQAVLRRVARPPNTADGRRAACLKQRRRRAAGVPAGATVRRLLHGVAKQLGATRQEAGQLD